MKNFFISFHPADQGWANWLVSLLEKADYTTSAEAWNIASGQNLAEDIQYAVQNAERTIIILSPNYLELQTIQLKWTAVFSRDPLGTQGFTIPVRVQKCELIEELSDLVYVDLVGLSTEAAQERLLTHFEQKSAEPLNELSFPESDQRTNPQSPSFLGKPSDDQIQMDAHLVSASKIPSSSQFDVKHRTKPSRTSDDVQKLLHIHFRRLQALQEKKAQYGLETPISIHTEIEDIQDQIAAFEAELEDIRAYEDAIVQQSKPKPAIDKPESIPFDPDDLEATEGVVALDSRFYVERHADSRLKRQMLKWGTTTTIIGARQMGKTSLLIRGIEAAQQNGFSIIFFDFENVDSFHLQDLDTFFRYLALNIATEVGISSETVDTIWQFPLGPKDHLNRFLEDHVLPSMDEPLILAFDEADQLTTDTAFRKEFFSLIRAWYTVRTVNKLWNKLSVVMAISTQPYLLIEDINLSPFNVGDRIRLEDFTLEQVEDLNSCHGKPLTPAELQEMMDLLGGVPYLVRQGLYTLIDEALSWDNLVDIADQPYGPFGSHLRQYMQKIYGQQKLIEMLISILKTNTGSDDLALHRLISAGLIKREGGKYKFRCQLYEQYFRNVLL